MAYIEITVRYKDDSAAFYTDDTGRSVLELRNVQGGRFSLGTVSADMMDALIAGAREDHRKKTAGSKNDDPAADYGDDGEPPF